ncbi:MAG: hypothetical protein J6Z46_03865 [Lachnospiraceae bacterium]|nr:hypothetical protein [Lachnospiraceae bacterium]MBP5249123.1 hypothetical protein [Lachnospiraceae bacterium]
MEQNGNNGISLRTYRTVDLMLLTLITCAVEIINILILKKAFTSELFTLSIVVPMSLIAIQRWNVRGVAVAGLGAIAYCVANNGGTASLVAYIGGNCFVLFNLLWYRKGMKQKISESKGLQVLFTLTGFIAVEVGRTALGFIFEHNIKNIFLTYIVSDSLNIVLGIVIVLIAARQDHLFFDQAVYLRQIQEERERNKKQQSTGGYHEEEQEDGSDT